MRIQSGMPSGWNIMYSEMSKVGVPCMLKREELLFNNLTYILGGGGGKIHVFRVAKCQIRVPR